VQDLIPVQEVAQGNSKKTSLIKMALGKKSTTTSKVGFI
jgi:hypothetical protein